MYTEPLKNLMLYTRLTLIAFILALHWLLLACGPTTIKDTTTQSYMPIQGWILELHQDVVIPPGRTRVFFQKGRMLYGINEFEPHCQLRVRDISEQPQPVHSDRFKLDKVFGTVDQIVTSGHIRLAAAGVTVIAGGGGNGGGDGESRLVYLYFMGLYSEKQPHVTYLVCGGALDDPAIADYPTIQDIRTSLGNYAMLILPGNS
jgi:hypothetical protein